MLEASRATVEDLMQRRARRAPALVSVAPSAQVRQALNLMRTWDVSQIPVIDDGTCLGTLMDGPLMAQAIAQPALLDRPVREVMETALPVVESSMAADRLALMLTRESPAALVQRDGALIGIVSRMDLLEQMIGTR
jgi:cystathionine beta-synthase